MFILGKYYKKLSVVLVRSDNESDLTLNLSSCSFLPIPERSSICGDPTAEADITISLLDPTFFVSPWCIYCTPTAFLPSNNT